MSVHPENVSPGRRIFCNRTLNLRSIQAIGYDMDYTLVHYNVDAWEGRAYQHMKQRLLDRGWPVDNLEFDHEFVTRGLVIDTELGNVVKANRFGYVKGAMHGTSALEFSKLRQSYARTLVELSEPRWRFMNTLFSISEACMYMQLVDLLDDEKLPRTVNYLDLYDVVREVLDAAHLEGQLKDDIMADPEHYVELDEDLVRTLKDQKQAGKKLLLITNSEWHYTQFMLDYAVNRYLPDDESWRDLFDIAVVSARKPVFFQTQTPAFEVVNDDGLLQPVVGGLEEGKVYLGGHASMIEECLGLDGERILYIGDHIYGDVSVSKSILRWRTALVLRELEHEMQAIEESKDNSAIITQLMQKKERLEHEYSDLRLDLQRQRNELEPHSDTPARELKAQMQDLRGELQELDAQIAPLVIEDGKTFNENWGYLMRAGNDKSHLTRQIERYADIYTSRVSNLQDYTPFMYFRSPRGSLPHDPI